MRNEFRTMTAFNDEELVAVATAADAEGWEVVSVIPIPMLVIGSNERDISYTILLRRPTLGKIFRIRITAPFGIGEMKYRVGDDHMIPEYMLQQRFGAYAHSFTVEAIIDPATVTKDDIILEDVRKNG